MIRHYIRGGGNLLKQIPALCNFSFQTIDLVTTRLEQPRFIPLWRQDRSKRSISFIRHFQHHRQLYPEPPVVREDVKGIFNEVWSNVEHRYGTNLIIPREIVWLNGAPGSGKGANTPFILRSRGLGRALCLSELLATRPESRVYMERGELIPEKIVVEALLSEIFDPIRDDGIGMIIDGYPRTPTQADTLKLLHEKLMEIYRERKTKGGGGVVIKPAFKIVVLHVDEETSIKRQQMRGLKESEKSKRAKEAGADTLGVHGETRLTDLQLEHCKKRYKIFKAHYGTLLRLKSFFPFHLIDAVGSLQDTKRQIARELRYQSSTDLEFETYEAIRHLPMAKELSKLSRMQLTARLDTYALSHTELFKSVIQIIDHMILPILRRAGMSGEAHFVTRNTLFSTKPMSLDILTDILSDRGYHVSYWPDLSQVPTKIDVQTGEITNESIVTHHFKIKFLVSSVRDLGDSLLNSGGSPMDSGEGGSSEICTSFMPKGSDHQQKYQGKASREVLVSQCLMQDLEYHQEGQSQGKDHSKTKSSDPEIPNEANVVVERSEANKHLH